MRIIHQFLTLLLLTATAITSQAQSNELLASTSRVISADPKIRAKQKVVVITGNRFSYPLIQKWIDDYNLTNPGVQIIIESRGTNDPSRFDILAEVYQPSDEIKNTREYLHVARYAIVPVATDKSIFAKTYADKGLTTQLIKQIFFHDIFADQEKQKSIKGAFTVYTRLQRAGAPIVFSRYFGHEQKDIKGTAIAGADEHLLKALLRDSVGVSYLPLSLAYDQQTRKPVNGLAVLPVDFNGNGKVSDDEKFVDDLDKVIDRLEGVKIDDIKNIPVEYLHLSIDKQNVSPEAVGFLKWVIAHGEEYLRAYGYLKPEENRAEKEKFNELASKRR